MAFQLGDRVKETSTTTGTGDFTLAGAASGYRSFASVLSTGDTTWYAAVLGTDWEVGLGTLSAATTLQRTQVIASSNGGALTSFAAGSKEIFVIVPASALAWLRTPRASFRNRIRNGNFSINQRSLSGTVTLAAGAYGHDGWKAGSGGCTYTFATSGGVTTLTISAGSLVQVIEGGLYLPEGGTCTLSMASGMTAQAKVNGGVYAAAPITVTGLTPGANATIEVGTGSLALIQFEPGAVATPYEFRDDELRRCQRYFCVVYATLRAYNSQATQTFEDPIYFPVTMRAAPTATLFAAGTRSANFSSISAQSANTSAARFSFNANATGDVYALMDGWSFSAEL